MKMVRKGMGRGQGKGYKNMIGVDSRVHSMSSKGIKQPQKFGRKELWDAFDKLEGREDSSFNNLQKERLRQGYDIKLEDLDKDNVVRDLKKPIIKKKTLSSQFKIINNNNVKLQNWRNDVITRYSNKGNDVIELINFIDKELLLNYKKYFPEYQNNVLDTTIPKVDNNLLELLEKKMNDKFPTLKKETELDKIIREKFLGYNNQRLVDKANKDFKANKNTDDVDFEIARRKKLGLINTEVGFDTIKLIE